MIQVPDSFDRKAVRWKFTVGIVLFLVWTYFTGEVRGDHYVFCALFLGLFWSGSDKAAYFGYLALPFLLVGVLYDNLKLALPLRPEIHVKDLYDWELAWFGVDTANGRQILPEWFKDHPVVLFDFFCGLAYITYLLEVFGVGALLFFKDVGGLQRLAWGWLLINILGMITWIAYPAAPPWYVEQYGLGPAVMDALPSAAGAARFDDLIGVGVFASFYSRNANVFGAMPSLHCGYPTLVLCVVWRYGWRWRVPTGAFLALVAFSAVYLRHHYVLDVLAGFVYGVMAYTGIWLVTRWRAHDVEAKENVRLAGFDVAADPARPNDGASPQQGSGT